MSLDFFSALINDYYFSKENPRYPKAVKQFLRRFDSKKILENLTLVSERLTDLIIGNLQLFLADFESETCQENMANFDSLITRSGA